MAIPKPGVGDLLKLTAVAVSGNQVGQMTCHQLVTAVLTGGLTLQEIVDGFQQNCELNLPQVLAPTAYVGGALAELIDMATGLVTQSASAISTQPIGLVGTEQGPRQAAAVVQKNTGLAGRRFRGRVFVPFLPKDFVNAAGELTGPGSTALALAVRGLFASGTYTAVGGSTSLKPVLAHLGVLPITTTDVSAFTTSGRIGTQRRRGDYGRPNLT